MKEIIEQKNIIDENKVNMIVSASAGSGKTFVMIERIMKILTSRDKNHADLDEMLILTFTNQSATEMSQRLEKKLMEKVDDIPELVEQLDLIRVCDISTIHAFCQKMLKKYFYEAKISADFELVSEDKQKMMANKCIKRAVLKFKNQNPQDYEDLLQFFSTSRSDNDIVCAVEQINNFLENQINPNSWIEQLSTFLYSHEGKQLYREFFNKEIIDFASHHKNVFAGLINNAGEEREKLKINLRKIYDFLDLIKSEQDFEQNQQALFSMSRLPQYSFQDADEFSIHTKFVRTKFSKKLKRLKDRLRFCDPESEEMLSQRAKNIIDNLLEIYKKGQTIYETQKQKKNLLDFSDLEHKFLKLLENPKICQSISGTYKYVFIDEFQDTNPVQMQILDKLQNSTIMTVGDIKQSIYGFRGSTPKIFQDMMNNYSSGNGGVAKTLNCNFRSNKDILNFANMIFSKIMTKGTSGVDYENDSQFIPQANYPRSQSPSVQICLTQKTKSKDEFILDGVYDLTKDNSEFLTSQNLRNEARVVAQKILQLKSQKIYDDKCGIWRDTNFSDITILVRSRFGIDTLCEELIACGVPIVASSNQMLCSFPEIAVVVNMTKLLLDRNNDVALVSALSSFFGGLDFEELSQIRIKNRGCEKFVECVQNYMSEHDDIANKLKSFLELFDRFEKIYQFEGLCNAMHFLIFDTGYNDFCGSQINGMGKCERIKAFFSLIEANADAKIGWLLEYFESDQGPTAPNFSTGERDFVGINTIHSSKGLEYPIVFLFGCEHELYLGGTTKKLNYSPNFGFATKYVDDDGVEYNSPQYEFIKTKNHQEEIAEELRLLYVALTRAKNTLVLCGICDFEKVEKIDDDDDVRSKTNYLDLILGSLDEKTITNIGRSASSLVVDENNFYSVELFVENDEQKREEQEKNMPILSRGSKEIVEQLNRYINFNYSHKNSINLCQKNTVSSLAFEQNEYSSKITSPKRFEKSEHEASEIAANDLGTLYHLIFEKIDFSKHYNLEQINHEILDILGEENAALISSENVLKIVQLLNPYLCGKVFREKEFIAKIRQNEIVEGGECDDLIVQGKIDLLVLGEKNYIFDYKITKINDENTLINKYKKQLALYKLAVEKATNKTIDEVYVVDVNRTRLIKCQNI